MEFILFINMLLYLLTAYYAWRKYKLNVYSFLWIYFSVFAVMGFIVVITGIYDDRFYKMGYNTEFSFFPYVCNYICVYMILFPFKYLKVYPTLGANVKKHKNSINLILTFISILFLVYLLLKLVETQEYSKYSLLERRELAINGEFLFVSKDSNYIFWLVEMMLSTFQDTIAPFVIIACLAYSDKKIISQKKMILLLFLSLAPQFIHFLVTSNRSGLFFLVINLSYYFFLFYQSMSKKLRRKIVLTSVSVAIPVVILLGLITLARYEDSQTDMGTGVWSYFGEAFPNLGAFVYGQVDHYTYGMRLFPDYLKLLTGISITADGGLTGYQQFWTQYTGVEILVFKSLFGDLYIEFGTIGTLFFIGFISLMTTIYVRNSKHPFTCYALLSLLYAVCTNGVLDFGLKYGKLYMIKIILLTLVFGFLWRKFTYEPNQKILSYNYKNRL